MHSKNIRKEKEGKDVLQGKVEFTVAVRHHFGGGGEFDDGGSACDG